MALTRIMTLVAHLPVWHLVSAGAQSPQVRLR